MHRIFQFPLFFGIFFFACKPSKGVYPNGPFTGKVVSHICTYYSIEILSGNMDPARYSKTWQDMDGIYHNIFSAKNFCYLDTLGLYQNDTFEFYLIPDTSTQNCEACQVFEPLPPIYNSIKVTKINK